MRLRVVAGSGAGEAYTVEHSGAVLGRGETCQIVLDDGEASREHARVYASGNGYVIEDLGSTNGVLVNDSKIAERQVLTTGDRVKIGTTVLVVEDAETVAPPVQLESRKPAEETAEQPALPKSFKPERKLSLMPFLLIGGAVLLIAAGVTWVMLPSGKAAPEAGDPYAETEESGEAEPETAEAPAPTEEEVAPAPESALVEGTGAETATVAAEPATEPPKEAEPEPATAAVEPAPAPAAPAAETPPPAEAAPAVAPEPPMIVDYLWLDSDPSGATVEVNGEARGKTPLVVEHLPDGRYQVKLSKPGFEGASRFLDVPNDGHQTKVTLRQRNGSCRVESTPSGAAVKLGPRLLGTTPMLLTGLGTGEYELEVALPGYATATVKAVMDPARPTSVDAQLVKATGVLQITSIPGDAEVTLDGTPVGRTSAGATPRGPSRALVVDQVVMGRHQLTAVWHGIKSQPVSIELTPDELEVQVSLRVFVPNMRFKLTNDQERVWMLVAEDAEAYEVVNFRGQLGRVPRNQVASTTPISEEEAKALLEKAAEGN